MKMLKRMSSLPIAAVMCTAMATCAFAAELPVQKNSQNTELSSYMDVFSENRSTLEELMSENAELITQITALQKEVKKSGALTEEASTTLSTMSAAIQQQRQSIGAKRDEVAALKTSGQDSMEAGDTESAKAGLEAVEAIQEQQIALQQGLNELLSQKINYLNTFSDTDV